MSVTTFDSLRRHAANGKPGEFVGLTANEAAEVLADIDRLTAELAEAHVAPAKIRASALFGFGEVRSALNLALGGEGDQSSTLLALVERLASQRDQVREQLAEAHRLADIAEQSRADLASQLDRANTEVAEHRALFDLQFRRTTEAEARWRAEDPAARANIGPDLGRLVGWLMSKADAAEAELAKAKAEIRDRIDNRFWLVGQLRAMRAVVEAAKALAEVEQQRTAIMENCSGWLEAQKARMATMIAAIDKLSTPDAPASERLDHPLMLAEIGADGTIAVRPGRDRPHRLRAGDRDPSRRRRVNVQSAPGGGIIARPQRYLAGEPASAPILADASGREEAERVQHCPAREDNTHCQCWWDDNKPCCGCGSDEGRIDEPCASCDGQLWVDDENWQADPDDIRDRVPIVRTPGNGRIPCGACNHGGWNVPDGKAN